MVVTDLNIANPQFVHLLAQHDAVFAFFLAYFLLSRLEYGFRFVSARKVDHVQAAFDIQISIVKGRNESTASVLFFEGVHLPKIQRARLVRLMREVHPWRLHLWLL